MVLEAAWGGLWKLARSRLGKRGAGAALLDASGCVKNVLLACWLANGGWLPGFRGQREVLDALEGPGGRKAIQQALGALEGRGREPRHRLLSTERSREASTEEGAWKALKATLSRFEFQMEEAEYHGSGSAPVVTPAVLSRWVQGFDVPAGSWPSEASPDPPPTFASFLRQTRHGKKRHGAFHTPPKLTYWVAAHVVDPLPPGGPRLDASPPLLVDPACGAGDLLLGLARRLVAHQDDAARRALVLERCLRGVDASAPSVDACRTRLWLWALSALEGGGGGIGGARRLARSLLDATERAVVLGNSLVGASITGDSGSWELDAARCWPPGAGPTPEAFHWPDRFPEAKAKGGFDALACNPPFGRLRNLLPGPRNRERRAAWSRLLRATYQHQSGNVNLYRVFVERCLDLVRPGGKYAVFFPSSFLGEAASGKLRRLTFFDTRVDFVLRLPKRDARKADSFPGVLQDVSIACGVKEGPPPSHAFQYQVGIGERARVAPVELGALSALTPPGGLAGARPTPTMLAMPALVDPPLDWAILRALGRVPPFAGADDAPPVGTTSEGHLHETAHRLHLSTDPRDAPLVRRLRIGRYLLDVDRTGRWRHPAFVREVDAFLASRPTAADFLRRRDVLVGRELLQVGENRHLQFALMDPAEICGNSVRWVAVTDRRLDPFYVLAVLNCDLVEWYFSLFSWTYHVKNYELARLPVPRPPPSEQRALAKLAAWLQLLAGAETRAVREPDFEGGKAVGHLARATFERVDHLADLLAWEALLGDVVGRQVTDALSKRVEQVGNPPAKSAWAVDSPRLGGLVRTVGRASQLWLERDRLASSVRALDAHPWVVHVRRRVRGRGDRNVAL
ncbi:MAG: hypothetical protein Kow0069_11570 [Promethearchaeota archaeon]